MRATDAVTAVRGRALLVVVLTCLVTAAVLAVGSLGLPTYRSESRVAVVPTSSPSMNMRYAYYGGLLFPGLGASYPSLFASSSMRAEVERRLHLTGGDRKPEPEWQIDCGVVVHDDDVAVTVAGESPDPSWATRITSVATQALVDTALQNAALMAPQRSFAVNVFARTPVSPPRPIGRLGMVGRLSAGLVSGLAVGIAAALLADRRARRRSTAVTVGRP